MVCSFKGALLAFLILLVGLPLSVLGFPEAVWPAPLPEIPSGSGKIPELRSRSSGPPVLPSVSLRDLSGNPVRIASLRGHPLLVMNVMATWCTPCLKEIPSLARLVRRSHGGIEVVGVVEGSRLTAGLRALLKENHARFRILFDPGLALVSALRVFSLPTSFLVDAHGQVVSTVSGSVNWTNPRVVRYLETFQIPKAGP